MYLYDKDETSNDFDITICILLIIVIITEVLFGVHKADSVSLALIYVMGVLLISYFTSGYHFGIAAALILSFLYNSYEPLNKVVLGNQSQILLGIMLVTLLTVSIFISKMKSKAANAGQRADRSDLIYEINQQLLTASDLDSIIKCALYYAEQQIGRSVVLYTDDPLMEGSGTFSEKGSKLDSISQRKVAHEYFVDPNADPTPYSDSVEFYYYPVFMDSDTIILLGVYFEYSSISKNDVFFIRDLMWHVGVAAEFQSILHMKHRSELESEKEKVRNTLLRSISHDLRTPLTGILGESTLIADHADSLETEDIKIYAEDIKENSQWLIRMVENLLIVTKITGDTVDIKKIEADAEEILAQAVSIVRKRYIDCNICVDAPTNPVYVPMDGTLMTQVLINIIDNAVKYSPEGSPVKLNLEKDKTHVSISVSDEGEGLSEDILSNILDDRMTEMKSADSKKGFGLGLIICKTIVKAHGGSIVIKKGDIRGTVISVKLPL